jgi:glycerol dehydrogenase
MHFTRYLVNSIDYGGRKMAKILISPGKYVQGSGEISKLGEYTVQLGKKALVLISESGYKRTGSQIEESFHKTEVQLGFEYFNGECSKTEVNRLRSIVSENNYDILIGVGGGKIFDTAKAVAYYEKLPVVICPTIASSDAPCSALSVLYTDDGMFEEYLFLPVNPNLVLMDTEIITKSPVRLTVAGMGDALATYFEARACLKKNAGTCAGGTSTGAAMALAELCFDTLMAEGFKAKLALEAGACTEAVEKIIEANTLLSGLGFESGGIAAAHAIHNGFTVIEECHHLYHGEKVAFGTISQLVLENASEEELEEVIEFCISVGLPVTLKELGIEEVTKDKIMKVSEAAAADTDTAHNMPFEVTADKIYAAIMAADAYGRFFLE